MRLFAWVCTQVTGYRHLNFVQLSQLGVRRTRVVTYNYPNDCKSFNYAGAQFCRILKAVLYGVKFVLETC